MSSEIKLFPLQQATWAEGWDQIREWEKEYPNFIACFESLDTVVTHGLATPDAVRQDVLRGPYQIQDTCRDGCTTVHAPHHTLITLHLDTNVYKKSKLYLKIIKAAIPFLSEQLDSQITYDPHHQGLDWNGYKIASIGLGELNGRTQYGISLYFDNIDMFDLIDPCLNPNTKVKTLNSINPNINKEYTTNTLAQKIVDLLSESNYNVVIK